MILRAYGYRFTLGSMARYCARIFLWKGAVLATLLMTASLVSSFIGHSRPIMGAIFLGLFLMILLARDVFFYGTLFLWGFTKLSRVVTGVASIIAFLALVYLSFFRWKAGTSLSNTVIVLAITLIISLILSGIAALCCGSSRHRSKEDVCPSCGVVMDTVKSQQTATYTDSQHGPGQVIRRYDPNLTVFLRCPNCKHEKEYTI